MRFQVIVSLKYLTKRKSSAEKKKITKNSVLRIQNFCRKSKYKKGKKSELILSEINLEKAKNLVDEILELKEEENSNSNFLLEDEFLNIHV